MEDYAQAANNEILDGIALCEAKFKQHEISYYFQLLNSRAFQQRLL